MIDKKEDSFEITTGNIFATLGLEQPDELLVKAELLDNVKSLIKKSGLSQKEVAEKLRISQPKVSQLVNGKISEFSLDSLLYYLSIIGCDVEIKIKKPRSKINTFKNIGSLLVSSQILTRAPAKKVTKKKKNS